MPELPEVETMRRGIAAVVGSRVVDVRCVPSRQKPIRIHPPLGQLRSRVVGRKIIGVARLGKRLAVELDCGDRLVFEPRMTGCLLVVDPPDQTYVRLIVDLQADSDRSSIGPGQEAAPGPCSPSEQAIGRRPSGCAEVDASRTAFCVRRLVFSDVRGFGVVQLLGPDEFAGQLGPQRFGPDALKISADELHRRLGCSRRAIKVALLDQRRVAGVGNIYASEILHRARVHPATPCNRLRPAQWKAIHRQMRRVLNEAISYRGCTLADGRYRTPSGEAGRFQSRLKVFQRAGQRCSQCGRAEIVRTVQAQRSTFFCPACQPLRRRWTR